MQVLGNLLSCIFIKLIIKKRNRKKKENEEEEEASEIFRKNIVIKSSTNQLVHIKVYPPAK